jgi:hypothetical protein
MTMHVTTIQARYDDKMFMVAIDAKAVDEALIAGDRVAKDAKDQLDQTSDIMSFISDMLARGLERGEHKRKDGGIAILRALLWMAFRREPGLEIPMKQGGHTLDCEIMVQPDYIDFRFRTFRSGGLDEVSIPGDVLGLPGVTKLS